MMLVYFHRFSEEGLSLERPSYQTPPHQTVQLSFPRLDNPCLKYQIRDHFPDALIKLCSQLQDRFCFHVLYLIIFTVDSVLVAIDQGIH